MSRLMLATLCPVTALALVTAVLAGCSKPEDAQLKIGRSRPVTLAMTTSNGLDINGLGPNGIQLNGIQLNGIQLNGIQLNGIQLNGIQLNGIQLNGIQLNGIQLNGIQLNGIQLNGIQLNGIQLNGIQLNGIQLNGIQLNGIQLNGVTEGDFEVYLRALVACALPAEPDPNACITYTTLDGAIHTACGVYGIDPGWRESLPDLTVAGEMGQCMLDNFGATFYDTTTPAFKRLLEYAVSCALDADQQITVTDHDGSTYTLAGSLGFATEWADSPLSPEGQRRVSACLAARSNAHGKTVRLSLRTVGHAPATQFERSEYMQHEGAFWGNLFAETPYINTCTVDGGNVSGRLCTQDDGCGFTPKGWCPNPDVCSDKDPIDNVYYNCLDAPAVAVHEVVNTFLPMKSNSLSATGNLKCAIDDANRLWCWGNDRYNCAPALAGIEDVVAVSLDEHGRLPYSGGYLLKADGTLLVWRGSDDPTDVGCVPTPVLQEDGNPLTDVVDFSVSAYHSCAVKADGSLWCWGTNINGVLGRPTVGSELEFHSAGRATIVDGVVKVKVYEYVTWGQQATCVLRDDGAVWCFGDPGLPFAEQDVQVDGVECPLGDEYDVAVVDSIQIHKHTVAHLAAFYGLDTPNTRFVDLAIGERDLCMITEHGHLFCYQRNRFSYLSVASGGSFMCGKFLNGPSAVKFAEDSLRWLTPRMCYFSSDHSLSCWGWDMDDSDSYVVDSPKDMQYGNVVHAVFSYGEGLYFRKPSGQWFLRYEDGDPHVVTEVVDHSCGNGVKDQDGESCGQTFCPIESAVGCPGDFCESCTVTDGDLCGYSVRYVAATDANDSPQCLGEAPHHLYIMTDCEVCGRRKSTCNTCTACIERIDELSCSAFSCEQCGYLP